jgi:hypothetical protein
VTDGEVDDVGIETGSVWENRPARAAVVPELMDGTNSLIAQVRVELQGRRSHGY